MFCQEKNRKKQETLNQGWRGLLLAITTVVSLFRTSLTEGAVSYNVVATVYPTENWEVSLPDVFIKWGALSSGSFDNPKWYPAPFGDRYHTESGTTFIWDTRTYPPEAKPNPQDIDFFQYRDNFKQFYINRKFEVRVTYPIPKDGVVSKSVIVPVNAGWDGLGPWNMQDNYWDPSDHPNPAERRRMHTGLPRGVPAAWMAFDQGYLDGFDETRKIRPNGTKPNGAGIDLSFSVQRALGFPELGREEVLVEFLWLDEGSGAIANIPQPFSPVQNSAWHPDFVYYEWSGVSGATLYKLWTRFPNGKEQEFEVPNTSAVLMFVNTTDVIGAYHWKIRAFVNGEWYPYSETIGFSVENQAPIDTTLIASLETDATYTVTVNPTTAEVSEANGMGGGEIGRAHV